ncbi:MAG: hypothetical protein M9921_12510 [Fimbriimonadaceae bacterium]|nr:hypothetical protein [Fimbriimonadaceae bacterium]
MLGALITFAVCAGVAAWGRSMLSRWLDELDPAAAWGVGGLFGLGLLGTASLLVGLVPGGLKWGLGLPLALSLWGFAVGWRRKGELRGAKPEGGEWAFVAALALALLFALVGAITPSDMSDWDSLAYHLAVPKMWIAAGQISYVSFIHHSNFPLAIDLLYAWGLQWGGESGAKAFSVAIFGLGLATLFGLARGRWGARAGWWAALCFAGIPAVLWESGTAYIDIGHGLFAGLGLWFVAAWLDQSEDRTPPVLAGLGLGLAMGSKYTGLQSLAVGLAVLGAGAVVLGRFREGVRAAALMGVLAVVLAAPWYAKNVAWTGNPVYPFFFERFGGRNWSQPQADVYRDEQQSFGVGRTESGRDLTAFGEAVVGLAAASEPFINRGQYPLGTLGVAVLAGGFLWAFAGLRRGRRLEAAVLASVLLSLALWFVLSQQSRYILTLAVPLSILAGGAAVRLRAGPVLAGVVALQAAYSLWMIKTLLIDDRLPVALGRVTREEFLTRRVPFYAPSQALNEQVKGGKVALYDEVFGYFLDVPYFWANPGHSSEIPYAALDTGGEYAAALKRQGFTHVYVSLSPVVADPGFVGPWLASMGLAEGNAFPEEQRQALLNQFQTRWKVLLADAVRAGDLQLVAQFRSGLLFEVR